MTGVPYAAPLAGLPMATGPVDGRMVIACCSARKSETRQPMPALELYQGGCIPALRWRIGTDKKLRARVRILSAEHGLITADTPLLPYDRPLDSERAHLLRTAVTQAFITDHELPREALVVAEPLYLIMLADLLATSVRVHWIPDLTCGWEQAAKILDHWEWA